MQRRITFAIVASFLAIFGTFALNLSAQASSKPLGSRYLLLVNTAIASMMTDEKLKQFDKSPYDGLAVAFLHAYDTSSVPTVDAMDARLAAWKADTSKAIWPWVYINRMLAIDPADANPYSKDAYFKKFDGADLDGKAGAQADFLLMWNNSLRAARDSASPGVVCDLEFYNYQKAYEIPELAARIGQSPEATVASLRTLGARMADAAAQQYPTAVLWFLFTGLTHPTYKTVAGQAYYPAPSYLVLGLLDEIRAKHLHLTVVSGGEGSLGYCHESLPEFQAKIADRSSAFASHLARYGDSLELSGTMTLWSDKAAKRNWVNQFPCDVSPAATVEELQPYLELMLKSYRYNWIYGSADGGYDAYKPEIAARFDAVIRKALAAAPGARTN
jgi:hypothetical protein